MPEVPGTSVVLLTVMAWHAPVPVRATACGLAGALSEKLSEALRLPMADGVKVRLTVHVSLGVTVAPVQWSVLAKSVALVPFSATDETVRFAVPVLVSVMVCAALVVSMVCEPKVREEEEKLAMGCGVVGAVLFER